jgi:hypothetical protein
VFRTSSRLYVSFMSLLSTLFGISRGMLSRRGCSLGHGPHQEADSAFLCEFIAVSVSSLRKVFRTFHDLAGSRTVELTAAWGSLMTS